MIGARFLVVSMMLAACNDDPVSHIFAGRLYETARNCVDPTSGIDVVDGPQPGACTRACLLSPPDFDSGLPTVYVSTMCAPFPPFYDLSGKAAACGPALAAYDRDDTCFDGGGSLNPPDASADASDAGVDAPHD